VLGVFILIFAWNILGFWNKMRETSRNEKIAAQKVADLQQQKEKLSSDIDSLKTEEGKEKVFRENYGLAKEGEGVIIVVDDKNAAAAGKAKSSGGFFSFFTNWLRP